MTHEERPYNYNHVHSWLIRHYGKATKCSKDLSHKAKRYEWSNISGDYLRDISDYEELCPSCHRKKDYTEHQREIVKKVNLGNQNADKSPVCAITPYGMFDFKSITAASRKLKVSRTAIANCLAGRSDTAGGYIWKRL